MTLDSTLEKHFRLTPAQKSALKKIGLEKIEDLLYHFPTRYGDTAEIRSIASLAKGEEATLYGKISKLKTGKSFRTKIAMADGRLEDESGSIKLVWFNQPYIAKMIQDDSLVRVQGKVLERKAKPRSASELNGSTTGGELYISNPKIEVVTKAPLGVGDSLFGPGSESHTLYPIYPESRGITSNWIYHAVQKIFKTGILETVEDPLPSEILAKYNLPGLKTALIWIHAPLKESDALAARKRFAFEEVFFIQLEKQKNRIEFKKNPSFVIEPESQAFRKFIERFPFQPTAAQSNAINDIFTDFKRGHAMSRLLEGDVGSGKTFVAAATVYAATTTRPKGQTFGNLQTAYMVPTEILAKQHFESFIQHFAHLPIQIGLITSSGCQKFPSKVNQHEATDISRRQLLKWVANGEIPILIGTHALIQKTVKFKNLAYVIIDEQHRFGTKQRKELVRKDNLMPHLLSMTATPIPRTLALTIFGDLDLTLLDQMPLGRKPILTEIVLPNDRKDIYEKVRTELKKGKQVYVICPRIDEPDPDKETALQAKSVTEEAKRLKKDVFPEYEIEILHSKMKPAEKDAVMEEFKDGKINILVATSVVEVGVNVPNATVILIEGAERFGLAQLHQLRGRVIRSNDQAYCYVFTESKSKNAFARLKALKTAKNGFELAEFDLQFRGAGELYGTKQWGLSDVAMEALKNIKMVEAARKESLRILETDPEFKKYPLIKKRVSDQTQSIHFE